jgi:hypothetical protein
MSLKDNPEYYHFTKLTFSSLRNQETRYVCKKMNFIAVGYYYFIGRFLIFNFSFLTEPEVVRK